MSNERTPSSKQIAMQAGSWFDRKDLTLEQRETEVAKLIEAYAASCPVETPQATSNQMSPALTGLVLRLQEWSRNCLIDGLKMDKGEPTLQALLREAYLILMRSPSETPEQLPYLDVVFDGPPSHESGRFVEVEDPIGRSVNAGEWIDRGDGLWALRIGLARSAVKTTETPAQRRAVTDAAALADAHRMYEQEHGEPFTENGSAGGKET